MKKLIAIATAVFALASCAKDAEVVAFSDSEIGFKALSYKATKADGELVNGTVFPEANTFKVWGFFSEEGDFSELAADAASNFMNGLKIEFTGGKADRTPAWRNADNYYYWPYTGKIGFYAVAPFELPAPAAVTAPVFGNGLSIAGYTIAEASRTTDLMFGYADGQNRVDALPLVFHHALSQICFMVKTDEDYTADAKFEITSLELNKIDLSGDFAYNRAGDAAWSANAAQTEDFAYCSTAKEAVKTAAEYGVSSVMVPQVTSTKDADENTVLTSKMTIKYKMTNASNEVVEGTVVKALPTEKWEMGRKYIYTLNFKLNEILFAPTAEDWVAVEVAEVVIP